MTSLFDLYMACPDSIRFWGVANAAWLNFCGIALKSSNRSYFAILPLFGFGFGHSNWSANRSSIRRYNPSPRLSVYVPITKSGWLRIHNLKHLGSKPHRN